MSIIASNTGRHTGRRVVTAAVCAALAALLAPVSAGAGPEGSWTKISNGGGSSLYEAGLVRTPNGRLHVVWPKRSGSLRSIGHSVISAGGELVGAPNNVVTLWDIIVADPELIRYGATGLRVVFGGSRTISASDPYVDGSLYTATSATGSTWNLVSGSMSSTGSAYASYGTGAALAPGAVPLGGFVLNSTLRWHTGVDPAMPATVPDRTYNHGGCCLYDLTFAKDGSSGAVVAAYYSNADGSRNGIFVKSLEPTVGARVRAPSSATSGGDSLSTDQAVAATGRPGRSGIYVAYCAGYPTCAALKLWRVGSSRALTVPGGAGADEIGIASAPGGRLWIFWEEPARDRIYAVRTNASVTRFGEVRSIELPDTSATVWTVQGEGSRGPLDLVVNMQPSGSNPTAFYHQQIRPGLTVNAGRTTIDNATPQTVSFRVTDAGSWLAGAQVRFRGAVEYTNASGIATFTIPAGATTGWHTATARKGGYHADTTAVHIV